MSLGCPSNNRPEEGPAVHELAEAGKYGIALLNMGSPATAGDSRKFLFRLFSDPDIFRFPGGRILRPLFAGLVSTLRAPKARRRYEALGGTSPLLDITCGQARALEAAFSDRGSPMPVEVCMRYSRPFSGEAVGRLLSRGADRIVGVPLYPQFSRTTTGSSLHALREAVNRLCPRAGLIEIRDWHQDLAYQAAVVRRIVACLGRLDRQAGAGILFLAHSIPERFCREGDPYVDQIRETVSGIIRGVGEMSGDGLPWFLAFQGQVGPVRWVGPTVKEVLKKMAGEGILQMVVVPVSFVSDHLETLYEIDVQYRRLASESGVTRFERIESLNASEDFVQALADLICRRLEIAVER